MAEQQRLYDLVVIGASAGGIEALSLLVATLPESFSAPIVIAQHIDPNATSHLNQILTRRSKLPVHTMRENAPEHLVDGVIYVIPQNRDVEITDDVVHLLPGVGQHPMPSIDRLFSSAAHAYGERVIAVVLTGSGSDGTAGAREVKAAGGAVLIENPATASYPAMPASLAPTTVDLVVDLERMGPLIADLIIGAQNLTSQSAADILPDLLEKVRQHTGIDFSQYKSPTIMRRLHRRMVATGVKSLLDYGYFLDSRPEEYQHLVASFLINVTEFFRDQSLFNFLRERVIPDMISRARADGDGKELRIWSAGCATGEEPYSIAILLAEALGAETIQFNIRIFATDVDADAIAYARRGQYPVASFAKVSDDLRAHYFTPTEHGYEVAKSIRNMVIFGEHDLGQRAPFPRMDMVVCRNVLIYFATELQTRILKAFAFSLRDSGYLVLGAAETADALSAYFSLVHPNFRVYRRRGDRVLAPPLPFSVDRGRRSYETPSVLAETALNTLTPGGLRIAPAGEQVASTTQPNGEQALTHEIGQRVYTSRERFANQILSLPVGVVVIDRNYDVQTINNAAYTLLDIHRPALGKDLLHLAMRVPTKPLRAAIDAVFQVEGGATPSGAMTINVELEQSEQENKHVLQITCYPYMQAENAPSGNASLTIDAVILLVSEAPSAERPQDSTGGAAPTQGGEQTPSAQQDSAQAEEIAHLIQQLELERALNRELRIANRELRETSDSLRRANEDLLVAHEEAQASSEETITLNEEMQATNEELETLNEELEATVEELHTTNDDLQARTQELQAMAQEKEAQRQASERERGQLEAILSSMGDALLAVDATRKQTLTNEAYQRLFSDVEHLALEDVMGNPLPPEAAPWRRVGEGVPFIIAFTIRAPDGSRRWFEATGEPIRSGESTLGGVVTIRDLSDRSIRGLYERFLGRASHELKNPLTSLMITIQMMQKHLPAGASGARLRTMAANMMRYARQLDVTTNDLKDLQHIQHDKLELTLEPVNLVALVHQIVSDIELIQPPDRPHPPIVVQAPPEIEPLWVLGDALRIAQIMQNLLTNALKYAPDSKRIDVLVRRIHEQDATDKAELEVRDYGPGIAAADLDFLFTPFYQALHERASPQGGLGLGLYIVQQLVKALGGDVKARSPKGQGAVFTIQLPLAPEGVQAETTTSDASREMDADANEGD